MNAFALPWLGFVLLTSCEAQQHNCLSSESNCAADRTEPDSVSLLQSRGIVVEKADDGGASSRNAMVPPKQKTKLEPLPQPDRNKWKFESWLPAKASQQTPAAPLQQEALQDQSDSLLSYQHLLQSIGLASDFSFGVKMLVVLALLLAVGTLCWLLGYRNEKLQRESLESRVGGVLESIVGGKDLVQGQASHGPHDMPPPLAVSNLLLEADVELVIARNQIVSAASTGGDIMLLAPSGALLLRATTRKIDADLWLEIAMQVDGGAPSAMVRLTNKEVAPKAHFFSQRPPTGPEIFGPDGSFYGMVEMNRMGARLVSSTTGQPVFTVDGDLRSLQLTVRTKSGLGVAMVTCNSTSYLGDVNISVHSGADLVLLVSLVLSVIVSAQL